MFQELLAQPWLAVALFIGIMGIGTFAGTLAGLFGIGGGIILVPAISSLLHGLGASPDSAMRVAVATSLSTIIPTSLASLRAHAKRGNIDWVLMKRWTPMLVLGALVGSWLAGMVSSKVLGLLFSFMLLFLASRFLRPATTTEAAPEKSRLLQRVMAAGIGGLSAMLGIGGGVIGVPALCYIGLPLKRAIGSASTFGLLIAIPGVSHYLFATAPLDIPLGGTFGLVHPLALALLVPGALLGAPFGAYLTHRLPVEKLRRGFAVMVLLLGLKMLYTSIF